MKILLTGASGFLGNIFFNSWKKDYEVSRLGRNQNDDFQQDLTSSIPALPKFDMVVHAAGKAHMVPKNAKEEKEFYEVNLSGTLNLLNALEANPPGAFVFISSVSVYGLETGENIDETFPLKATDAYGKSKIDAENEIRKWGTNNKVNVVILRLPLIAGPNPPGNLGAMMNAIRKGYYFRIGNGEAKRSVVIATDVARFIPKLIDANGIYNLACEPQPMIKEIDTIIGSLLHKKVKKISPLIIKSLALFGDIIPFFPVNSVRVKKLTLSLTFSSQLAREKWGWKPHGLVEKVFS